MSTVKEKNILDSLPTFFAENQLEAINNADQILKLIGRANV